MRRIAMTVAALLLAAPAIATAAGDLRELRVGMAVAELPASGYLDFTCAATPGVALSGWQDWRLCPADPAGRHEMRFRYDQAGNPLAQVNDKFGGTRVGGHPVLLSVLIGGDARVDGIRIVTDPAARLYMRKKAFLLAEQVKARYGPAGWICSEAKPGPDRQPVGGAYFDERCEKTTATRRLRLDRQLYRRADQGLKDFVGSTELLILPAG